MALGTPRAVLETIVIGLRGRYSNGYLRENW